MTDFDLAALEKALSTKSRRPRQDLTLKPGLSKRELYDEAKRLANEYDAVYSKRLRTRHQGDSYCFSSKVLYKNDYHVDDFEQVPKVVFEKLVVDGRRHMKVFHDMINAVIMQNPGIALEANLEGKTGSEMLNFAYTRRFEQIEQLLKKRVSSPEAEIYFKFKVRLTTEPPFAWQEFNITISSGSNRSPSVSGIELNPKKEGEMAKLVHFVTYFEQVANEINRQLDAVEIRKEVIK